MIRNQLFSIAPVLLLTEYSIPRAMLTSRDAIYP